MSFQSECEYFLARESRPSSYSTQSDLVNFLDRFNFAIFRLCENVNGETGKWEEDLQNGEVLSNKTDLSHLNNFKQSL